MSSGFSSATPQDQWESWFQAVWSVREDVIYPHLFGEFGKRIATIPPAMFQAIGIGEIDPRWTTNGVVTSPPQPNRPNWVYISSGLSNPWGLDPARADKRLPSGLGFELMMQTPEPAPWVYGILHWLMAVQILAAAEYLKGEIVRYGDLVPLGRSVDPEGNSPLRNLLIVPPDLQATRFELDSGTVDLLLCVGITDTEHQYALDHGSDLLLERLKAAGAWPATDPGRASVAG